MGDAGAPSAALPQLRALVAGYRALLPMWTFPFLPLAVAALFQCLAWVSGPILLHGLTLAPRVLILLLFACGEYAFMSPTMNAGVEVLGMRESLLVVVYHATTLVVFMLMDLLLLKREFQAKYAAAFALVAAAVYIAYMG